MMTAVMLVTHVPVGYAIALFSIAFFAQQSWSGIIMTIPADVFPLSAVGTVAAWWALVGRWVVRFSGSSSDGFSGTVCPMEYCSSVGLFSPHRLHSFQ
jgi:hypothetical protein